MTARSALVFAGLCCLALAAAPLTAAAVVNPVMDFGSGYALEGTRVVGDQTSTAGDQLLIVGHVVQFQDPFGDLDPNDPTKEYTYVYSDLTSQGTIVTGGGSFIFYDTAYNGGVLRVYCDPAMDSDFANPASFANGDLILEAAVTNFSTSTRSFTCSGNQNAEITFTGGSLLSRLAGFQCGIITGLFSVCTSQVPAARQAEGYFGLSDTKIDVDCPVPSENSTWGRIKTQY